MVSNSKSKSSNWKLFSVKLIFEYVITGNPDPRLIDKNYSNNNKFYEESIVLVRAQSFEHAYKIAERKAKEIEMETTHYNPYDEKVEYKFVRAIDCFNICDEILNTGTELYSRFVRVGKNLDTEKFLDLYFPDTVQEDNDIDYKYILRYREFNKKPIPKGMIISE